MVFLRFRIYLFKTQTIDILVLKWVYLMLLLEVLLTKKSTIFYRDSLKKFTTNIPLIIGQNMQKNYGFTVDQIKNTNILLESSFG